MIEVEVPGKGIVEFPEGMSPRDIEHSLFSTWPDLADTPQKQRKRDLLAARDEALRGPTMGAYQEATAEGVVEGLTTPFAEIPRPPKLEPGPEVPLPVAGKAIHTVTRTLDTVFEKLIGAVESLETPLGGILAVSGGIAPKAVGAVVGLMGGGQVVQGTKEAVEAAKTGDVAGVVGGGLDVAMGAGMVAVGAKAGLEAPKAEAPKVAPEKLEAIRESAPLTADVLEATLASKPIQRESPASVVEIATKAEIEATLEAIGLSPDNAKALTSGRKTAQQAFDDQLLSPNFAHTDLGTLPATSAVARINDILSGDMARSRDLNELFSTKSEDPRTDAEIAESLREQDSSPPVEPVAQLTKELESVPRQSPLVEKAKEMAATDQSLGIASSASSVPGLQRAIKGVVDEIASLPKFTPFKESVNRWFGENQKTSLEVRALQKEIKARVPNEVRREAITSWLQAGGDVGVLDAWSKASKSKRAKEGYLAAKALTPDEIKVAESIRGLYDNLLAKAQKYDLVQEGIDNYVTQVWQRGLLSGGEVTQFAAKVSRDFQFGKQRTFESFFEGEQAGFQPLTKDISQLVGIYVSEMGKTIATRDFVKDLTTKTATDGRPLAVPQGVASVIGETAADGPSLIRPNSKGKDTSDYRSLDNRALAKWKWVGEDPESGRPALLLGNLAVHPDIYAHVRNVLGRSEIKRWYESPTTPMGLLPKALAKALDQGQSLVKQTMLGFFAPFHHVQEATHAVGHKINPLFDLPKLDPADPALQRAMDHGLAIAGDSAAMASFREGLGLHEWAKKSPALKPVDAVLAGARAWSDFLFHEYIPRLKYKTYQAILKRNSARYAEDLKTGQVKIDDVEYLSAKQTDAAYGHLNYADIGRNPTLQHMLRSVLLAPDFLEARARFTGQAIKGLLSKTGREQLTAMATLAGTFYVGARIVNKLLDDDYHLEEPFGVIHDGRLYTMRSVPEDLLRLFKDSRKFAYGRISPVIGRGSIELLTGKNYRGEKVEAVDTFQDLLVSWIPITMREMPGVRDLSASQRNQTITAWESFIGAIGLQISRHSPISKTYQKANDFMKAQGVKEDRGSYPVSKYQQLRYALEDADIERATTEIDKLLEESATQLKKDKGQLIGKLRDTFKESLFHPWTKGRHMDLEFRRSLDEESKALLNEAEEQRKRIWQRFGEAVKAYRARPVAATPSPSAPTAAP